MTAKYEILWVASETDRRDYKARQLLANEKKADIYFCGHLNSKLYTVDLDGDGDFDADAKGLADNPASALVCDNASQKSQDIAKFFADECGRAYGTKSLGCVKLKREDRGYWNLYYTKMPAVLLEGAWVSDEDQATLMVSDIGKTMMAKIIVKTVRKFLPDGGKVAFSLGHKWKVTSIHDRGAPVVGTKGLGEADIMEDVMKEAAALLEAPVVPEVELPPNTEKCGNEVRLVGAWDMHLSHENGQVVTIMRKK